MNDDAILLALFRRLLADENRCVMLDRYGDRGSFLIDSGWASVSVEEIGALERARSVGLSGENQEATK